MKSRGDDLQIPSRRDEQVAEQEAGYEGREQNHQGRGVGRKILEGVVEVARASVPRPSRLKLSVFPANHRAIRLYERFGFAGVTIEDGERVMWLEI